MLWTHTPPPADQVEELSRSAGVSRVLGELLWRSGLREAGLAADDAARAERLISTTVLGFAASEAAGRFRHHDQAVIDEDFAVLLRWLRLAVSPGAT